VSEERHRASYECAERLHTPSTWEPSVCEGRTVSARIRHDVAFVTTPPLVEPLRGLMDEWQLGEYRAYCYEAIVAALEAYDRAVAQEQRRPSPTQRPPSEN
jgi:hypothetical protein